MRTMLMFLVAVAPAFAGDFAGLTPGRSTVADAKKALGSARVKGSTMTFDGDRFEASEIMVETDNAAGIIQAITVVPKSPPTLDDVTQWFQLKEPDAREKSGDDEILTYHPQLLRLTLRGKNVARMTHVAPGMITSSAKKEIETRLANGDRTGVVADLIKLRSVNPADPDLAFTLAETLMEEGELASAAEVVGEGLRASPENEYGELLKAFIDGEIKFQRPGWPGVHMGDLRVTRVFKGGPADAAGVLEGDVILSVKGEESQNRRRLLGQIFRLKTGGAVTVKFQRGEATREVEITPIDRERFFQDYKPSDDLDRAMVLMERGRMTEAEDLLEKVAGEKPSPAVAYERAMAAEAVNMERGLKNWKRFLEAAGDGTPPMWKSHAQDEVKLLEAALPLYKKGRELEKADKFQEALDQLSRARVDSSNTHFYEGVCFKHLKRYREAVKSFATASAYWWGEPVAWHNIAECYETVNLAMCRAASARFLALAAGNEKNRTLIEKTWERKARVEAALAKRLLAKKIEAKGLLSQALADYEAASAACPNSGELIADRIRVLAALNRHKEAALLRDESRDLLPPEK